MRELRELEQDLLGLVGRYTNEYELDAQQFEQALRRVNEAPMAQKKIFYNDITAVLEHYPYAPMLAALEVQLKDAAFAYHSIEQGPDAYPFTNEAVHRGALGIAHQHIYTHLAFELDQVRQMQAVMTWMMGSREEPSESVENFVDEYAAYIQEKVPAVGLEYTAFLIHALAHNRASVGRSLDAITTFVNTISLLEEHLTEGKYMFDVETPHSPRSPAN